MKKTILTLSIVISAVAASFGQWTQSGTSIYTSNHVGIGSVTTPNAPLEISGYGLMENISNLSDQDFQITLTAGGASSKYALLAPSTNTNLAFGVGGVEKMRITNNGNLLIGKTSQTNTAYMLDVAGSARVNAIVVNTSGADFVFEPAYKLMPLSDLSRFLIKNHHLPNIQPAKAMQANGVDLGENQVKLLQKVEELTLYLIQKDEQLKAQNKKLDNQGKELDEEKEKNAALAARMQKLEAEVQALVSAKQ
jgi:hypothetical protein